METIQRDELKNLLDHRKSIQLINVLGPREFEKAHIPGSYNIPVSDKNFIQKVEKNIDDKSANIIVYCANLDCTASPDAARKLENAGYTQVTDFAGGIKDWIEGGYPVENGSQ